MAGHSSIIHLNLEVNGELFKITHLGGGFFRLRDAPAIAAGEGKIHVTTDGEHDVTDIFIKEDIPAHSRQRNHYAVRQLENFKCPDETNPAVPELAPA